jgi:hypothetical protein
MDHPSRKTEAEAMVATIVSGVAKLRATPSQRVSQLWEGAGIVVRLSSLDEAVGFYPNPRQLITSYAAEISWLLERLRDLFAPIISHLTKDEFYGRLIIAANLRLAAGAGVASWDELRDCILDEAESCLDDLVSNEFAVLIVTTGNRVGAEFHCEFTEQYANDLGNLSSEDRSYLTSLAYKVVTLTWKDPKKSSRAGRVAKMFALPEGLTSSVFKVRVGIKHRLFFTQEHDPIFGRRLLLLLRLVGREAVDEAVRWIQASFIEPELPKLKQEDVIIARKATP